MTDNITSSHPAEYKQLYFAKKPQDPQSLVASLFFTPFKHRQNTTVQTPIPIMAEHPNAPSNPPPPAAYAGLDRLLLYQLLERTEGVAGYVTGGYHPIEIGDELHHGRYRIIHRLGHGGYATVWLAPNQHYSPTERPALTLRYSQNHCRPQQKRRSGYPAPI